MTNLEIDPDISNLSVTANEAATAYKHIQTESQ